MTSAIIYNAATGQIRKVITAPQVTVLANVAAGEALINAPDTGTDPTDMIERHYVVNGNARLRPFLPELPTQGVAAMAVDLAAFPPNWVCTIINEDGDAYVWTPDMGTTLTLEDPGSYEITVTAPFPYRPIINHVITVSAAAEVGIDVSANTVVGGESIV